jgi:hypothetical protein
MNPNSNCLRGKKCPKCGSYGPFDAVGVAVFTIYDSGTDEFRNVDFDGNSQAYCRACNFNGKWSDFDENTPG